MPKMDGTGPQKEGPGTGRKLGQCKTDSEETTAQLGVGMGKRRKEGGGEGKKKRLQSGIK